MSDRHASATGQKAAWWRLGERPISKRELLRDTAEGSVALTLLGTLWGWSWIPHWYVLGVAWSGAILGFLSAVLCLVLLLFEGERRGF